MRTLALALTLLCLAGCGGSAKPSPLVGSWQNGPDSITFTGSGLYSETFVTANVFGTIGDQGGCTQTQSWVDATWSVAGAVITIAKGPKYVYTVGVSGCSNPHYDSPDGPSTTEPSYSMPLRSSAYTVTAGELTYRNVPWQPVTQ